MRVEKTMGCGNGVWEKPKDGEKDINLKKKKKKGHTVRSWQQFIPFTSRED